MALTDNVAVAQAAMVSAFKAEMETQFADLLDQMDADGKALLREGWEKFATAIAATLPSICTHISSNGEVDGNPGRIT